MSTLPIFKPVRKPNAAGHIAYPWFNMRGIALRRSIEDEVDEGGMFHGGEMDVIAQLMADAWPGSVDQGPDVFDRQLAYHYRKWLDRVDPLEDHSYVESLENSDDPLGEWHGRNE